MKRNLSRLSVFLLFVLAGCGQPTSSAPPVSTILSLTLQSDDTEMVDSNHPIRWEVSTTYNFTVIVKTGTVETISLTAIDIELDPGSYFVRAYIDNDNNGCLSSGDTFSMHGVPGDSQRIYRLNKIMLAEGDTETVFLRPGVNEREEDIDDIPADFGTIYIFLTYAGTRVVDSSHLIYLGIGQDPALSTYELGFSFLDSEKVYAIVSAGIWYAGGFFDANGNADTTGELPDSGDPTELFDGIVYNGVNTGTPIIVEAGTQTEMNHLELDDTLVY